MALERGFLLVILLTSFFFPPALSHGKEGESGGTENVILTPADQMILEAIARVNERIDKLGNELNGRIDNLGNELNGRIDKLWTAMVGGFLGVMAFIGGIVFWDRRTFSRRAKDEFRNELSDDRKKLEAMLAVMKKLSDRFPEVRKVLSNSGLL